MLRERRARGKVVLTVVVGEDELTEIARAGYAEAASTDRKGHCASKIPKPFVAHLLPLKLTKIPGLAAITARRQGWRMSGISCRSARSREISACFFVRVLRRGCSSTAGHRIHFETCNLRRSSTHRQKASSLGGASSARRGGIHIQAGRTRRQQANAHKIDDGANGLGVRIGGVEDCDGKADVGESLENCG